MSATPFEVRIGYIPLNDCAPIVAAQALGLFEKHGVRATLSREPSWANIRDKLAYGLLDAAHILAPMPLADALGLGVGDRRIIAPMSLGLNGNAVTVSTGLYEEMRAVDPLGVENAPPKASALAAALKARRDKGEAKPVLAVTFPYSMHNYSLRYWLAAGGVDPDHDVRLVVIPPQRMAAMLRDGVIDGFCVGAPWHAAASEGGFGRILISDYQFWGLKPEKVFGVSQDWSKKEPAALQAVLGAVLEAAIWADQPENRDELTAILTAPGCVEASPSAVRWALGAADGRFQIMHRYAANYPWRSQALWILGQMARWGQTPPDAALTEIAQTVYRPDLYAAAAKSLGVSIPLEEKRYEGAQADSWKIAGTNGPIDLAPDRFFDGVVFDSADPLAFARNAPFSKLKNSPR
jgi:two-component system, oxyanion-binding sensor